MTSSARAVFEQAEAIATATRCAVSVAVLHDDGTIEPAAFGDGVAVDTPFQAASLGKTIAAVLVLQAVACGRVGLDDPVLEHVPGWNPPASAHDWRAVTVRRALAHRAGLNLPDYPGLPPDAPVPDTRASLAGARGSAGALSLDAPPGEAFAYSGGGYTLLQLMLETVHDRDFATRAEAAVLAPLAMTRSSFDQRSPLAARAPTGLDGDGRPLPFYRFDGVAAAGLLATPADLCRFLAALHRAAAGTGDLLPTPLARAMHAPLSATDGVDGLWPTYGLGLEIAPRPDRGPLIGHHGMNRGWRAIMALDTDTGRALVAMANHEAVMPGLDALVPRWLE